MSGNVHLSIAARENPNQLITSMLNRDWLGHIACGYVLRRVISMHRNDATRSAASIAEAARMVEEWCGNGKGSIRGGTAQNITKNLWPKYKSVAHLWAALFTLVDADFQPQRKGMPMFMRVLFWNRPMVSRTGIRDRAEAWAQRRGNSFAR